MLTMLNNDLNLDYGKLALIYGFMRIKHLKLYILLITFAKVIFVVEKYS